MSCSLSVDFLPLDLMPFPQCWQFCVYFMTYFDDDTLFKSRVCYEIAEIIAKYYYVNDNKYKIIEDMIETGRISAVINKIIGFNEDYILWTSYPETNMLSKQYYV